MAIIQTIILYFKRAAASDFGQKVAESFFSRAALIVIGLVTSVIVTRSLGPEARGWFAIAVALSSVAVQFSNLGLHGSNTFYYNKHPNLLSTLTANTLVVAFTFGVFSAGITGTFCVLFPEWAPISGPLLWVSLISIPFSLSFFLLHNLLLSLHEVRQYNLIQLISKIFYVAVIIIIAIGNWISAEAIFSALVLASILSLFLVLRVIKKRVTGRLNPSRSLFKRCLGYGFKSYIGSLSYFMIIRVDLFMVNEILGAREAGFYDLAFNISDMVNILPDVVVTLLFPKLCAIQNVEEKWDKTKAVGLGLGITMVSILAVMVFIAEGLIQFLYGTPFLPVAPILILLIFSKLVQYTISVLGCFISSIHIPISLTIWGTAMVGFNIGLNYFLIPRMGLTGAAVASISSFFLMLIPHIYYCAKYLKDKGGPAPK